MNSDSLSDSFQDAILSKATPKRSQQANQGSLRSRFTILSDMNQTNTFSKKGQEQSLLSKYLKNLHEEQHENQQKSAIARSQQKNYYFGNTQSKDKKQCEPNDASWKRKNGKHLLVNKAQDKNKTQFSDNSRISQIDPEMVGIFVYKKKIDLNMPIDFELQDKENIHRNYGQLKSLSKMLRQQKSDEISFGAALAATSKSKSNKHSKFDKHN